MILPVASSLAQANDKSGIYLTNYTIPKEGNDIGFVKMNNGVIKSISVVGGHTDLFYVGKDNSLSVRQEKLSDRVSTYDLALVIETSSGKLTKEFRILKDNFIRNKVIAHRGAWKNTGATENSIAALNHAVKMGCEGSEFDVHMSADSIPVIHHDALIHGVSIAKSKSADLLSIKLPNGEPMPSLEKYLKAGMVQIRTKLILEIKPSELGKESSIALTRKVVALVEKLQAQAWVDYISFDYDVCKEVMSLAPYAKVAYLNGDKSPAELASDKFFGLDYNFNVFKKNPDWIKEAHHQKLTVNVWTVNDKPSLEDLLKQNVDFITTNEPELLLSMLKL
ncbi:MAG: glycerophosphodiester phosphodiesterase [Marivirga sp.]|nr:glycerophosphodiester phosphodiesterase [Marivirga sp.]